MAKLIWSMLCEKPLIDSQTNNVSLINIIEEFSVPNVPISIPQPFFIVSLWQRELSDKNKPENFEYRIMLVSPSKSERELIKYKVKIEKERHRTMNGIIGLKIGELGTHYISVEIKKDGDWKKSIRIPFYIRKA